MKHLPTYKIMFSFKFEKKYMYTERFTLWDNTL